MTSRIEANPAGRRELAQALLHWAITARSDGGTLAANVYEDLEAASVFYLVGRWANRSAFESHLRTPTFGSMVGAVELLAGPPDVAVAEIGDEGGRATTLQRLRDSRWKAEASGSSNRST